MQKQLVLGQMCLSASPQVLKLASLRGSGQCLKVNFGLGATAHSCRVSKPSYFLGHGAPRWCGSGSGQLIPVN